MNTRLKAYEERSSAPMVVLAIAFIAVYAIPILRTGLPTPLRHAFHTLSLVLWVAFALDLLWRVYLADRRWNYLVHHPIDVAMVALPVFRPLRVLKVFTACQAMVNNGGNLSLMKTTQAVLATASLLIFIGMLAVLDAERNIHGTHIQSNQDALWWAVGSVTGASYVNAGPTTETGRIIGVGLSILGLSLVGVITATVAAWFIAQTKHHTVSVENSEDRLSKMERQLHEIHEHLSLSRHEVQVDVSPESEPAAS